MPYKLPKMAEYIISRLAKADISAYLVGGAVRDMLLGKEAKDLDFAVQANVNAIMQVFPDALAIGGAYGTVSVNGCELTPCRSEGAYSDHRHPESVQFGADIYTDLARRDFTVNAMAFDGIALIDPYGGEKDLKDGILRCVGAPAERFGEDALRILRLFRFAAVHNFTVECDTFEAALQCAAAVAYLPTERVRNELNRILLSDNPTAVGPLLQADALRKFGLGACKSCVSCLCRLPRTTAARWWGLMHLTGADIAAACEAMGFSAAFKRELCTFDNIVKRPVPKDITQLKIMLATLCLENEKETLAAIAAMEADFSGVLALYTQLCESKEPYLRSRLAIGGAQLVELGLKGHEISRMLWELQLAVIKTPSLNMQNTLIDFVKNTKEWL